MNITILIYNTMAANGPILTDYYINSLIQRGDIFSGTFFIPNFGQGVREMVSVGYP
jgi:hypothetical protein